MERVGSITGTLLFMEVVVLDKGFYPVFLHEPVIFFLSSRNRSLPHRYPVSGYSDAGRSGRKESGAVCRWGVGNNWKSMMNWFSVPVVNYIQVWSACSS